MAKHYSNRQPEHSSQPGPGLIACLTILQPWSHLIVTPAEELPPEYPPKRIENRSWSTTHRGPLIIHAGKSDRLMDATAKRFFPWCTFGAAVGKCNLVACLPAGTPADRLPDKWRWVSWDQYADPTGYHWVLEDVERFPVPVPLRGQQGLFYVPVEAFRQCNLPGWLEDRKAEPAGAVGQRLIDFEA